MHRRVSKAQERPQSRQSSERRLGTNKPKRLNVRHLKHDESAEFGHAMKLDGSIYVAGGVDGEAYLFE